ncbi:MAG: hypothetical protein RR420_00955 [Anaerovoracaceae bacterium]
MACIAFRESDVLNMCQHKSGQDIIVPEEYIPRDEKAKLDDGIILMNNAVLIHISSMLKELVWIGTVTFKTGDEYRSRHLKVTLPTKSVLILEPIDKERAAYGYNR